MSMPRIYVFCPDLPKPLGGVRMLYRHIDILNSNGFEAYIVHSRPEFRIDWFEHSTRVCHGPEVCKGPVSRYIKRARWQNG